MKFLCWGEQVATGNNLSFLPVLLAICRVSITPDLGPAWGDKFYHSIFWERWMYRSALFRRLALTYCRHYSQANHILKIKINCWKCFAYDIFHYLLRKKITAGKGKQMWNWTKMVTYNVSGTLCSSYHRSFCLLERMASQSPSLGKITFFQISILYIWNIKVTSGTLTTVFSRKLELCLGTEVKIFRLWYLWLEDALFLSAQTLLGSWFSTEWLMFCVAWSCI